MKMRKLGLGLCFPNVYGHLDEVLALRSSFVCANS